MINRSEALRYLGAKNDDGIKELLDDAIKSATALSPKYVLAETAVKKNTDDGVALENGMVLSGMLARNSLDGCNGVLLITATLTLDADRLINTAGSPLKGAVMNAVLSATIEGYLDSEEEKLRGEYAREGKFLTPRFSPGYSDLPLALHRDILSATEAEKLLGVHLTENLMLVPVKSVTAIIGISSKPKNQDAHKCDVCKKPCIFRKV